MDKVINKTRLKKNFDRAAKTYDDNADFQKLVLQELIDSLGYLAIKPRKILDLGSGTGAASAILKKKYRNVAITQCDISSKMLVLARKKQRWLLKKDHYVETDMQALPFKQGSFDLVFSSLCLQWSEDILTVFKQIEGLLNPGGALVFSTLGPDSMKEFRSAWGEEREAEDHKFYDIQKYGDCLIAAGFDDPVLNVDRIVVHHNNAKAAVRSVKNVGASNVNSARKKTFTSKEAWIRFEKNYEGFREEGKLPLTYEVISGLAWKKNLGLNSVVNVPITEIKKYDG